MSLLSRPACAARATRTETAASARASVQAQALADKQVTEQGKLQEAAERQRQQLAAEAADEDTKAAGERLQKLAEAGSQLLARVKERDPRTPGQVAKSKAAKVKRELKKEKASAPIDRRGRPRGRPKKKNARGEIKRRPRVPSSDCCLQTVAPGVAAQWDTAKNSEPDHTNKGEPLTQNTVKDVMLTSKKKVWWRCPLGPDHSWKASVAQRLSNPKCPFCDLKSVSVTNCLESVYPKIAKQLHATLNQVDAVQPVGTKRSLPAVPDAKSVVYNSSKLVWWQCAEGSDHEFLASVRARTQDGYVCPFCANKRVSLTNSLATVFPDLAAQWHYTLNGELTPGDVTFTSSKHVWWRVNEKDGVIEWKASIAKRTRHCRFFGILRQRSRDDPELMAEQMEAHSNTAERRRQVRRARRQMLLSAENSKKERLLLEEELDLAAGVDDDLDDDNDDDRDEAADEDNYDTMDPWKL